MIIYMNFYRDLPQHIDRVFFSIGPITIYWYSLAWAVAFLSVYFLVSYRIKKDKNNAPIDKKDLDDIFLYTLLGAVFGGRIGYVVFYNLEYFLNHPLSIISPYNFETHKWSGIYGLSYHGGAVGVLLAIFYFTYKKANKNGFEIINYIIPAVPFGYFFGRIGNFLNGELYGRVTESAFGMYFVGNAHLRHPSQLYEAFGEGIILFIILWRLRNNEKFKKYLLSIYIMGYATARFIIEFFREPDSQLGLLIFDLSMGQLLSISMFFVGIITLFVVWRKK